MLCSYKLQEVYGIDEKPSEKCPTYLVRDVHKIFKYFIENEKQHIVVYGASKQGKSWLVEKYCPNFIRIGCDVYSTRESLFSSILQELGVIVGTVSKHTGKNTGEKLSGSGEAKFKIPFVGSTKVTTSGEVQHSKIIDDTISYVSIDLKNQSEVIKEINKHIKERFIIIENFHYLKPEIQKAFTSSLREFLYYDIRVIIVGIWKETTKLASYAGDISGRCSYCDIGDWSETDLRKIVEEGDKALNVVTSPEIVSHFILNAGYNVGIFKSFLKNFCIKYNVFSTNESVFPRKLNDFTIAESALNQTFQEMIVPVLDRIDNLATSKKTGSKGMRYYIVKGILENLSILSPEEILVGISFQNIVDKVNVLSNYAFDNSNIKQELMHIHLRAETGKSEKEMNTNLVPLFYFDPSRQNGTLYVVESALLFAKQRNVDFKNYLGTIDNYLNV